MRIIHNLLLPLPANLESGKICMLATTVKNAKNRFCPVHFAKQHFDSTFL